MAWANIIAGVNGAGKTSFYYQSTFDAKKQIEFGYRIDIDEIARSLGDWRDKEVQLKASKKALKIRAAYIEAHQNFTQETTLCGKSILKLFEDLKNHGFKIKLYYIGLDSIDRAKERVRLRVSRGGHGIDDEVIERRYFESFENFLKVLKNCHEVYLYDNSDGFKLSAKLQDGAITKFNKIPWVDNLLAKI